MSVTGDGHDHASVKTEVRPGIATLWTRWKHKVLTKDPGEQAPSRAQDSAAGGENRAQKSAVKGGDITETTDHNGHAEEILQRQTSAQSTGSFEEINPAEVVTGLQDGEEGRSLVEEGFHTITSRTTKRRSYSDLFANREPISDSDNSTIRPERRQRSKSSTSKHSSSSETINDATLCSNNNDTKESALASAVPGRIEKTVRGELLNGGYGGSEDEGRGVSVGAAQSAWEKVNVDESPSSSCQSSPSVTHKTLTKDKIRTKIKEMNFRQQLSQLRNRHGRNQEVMGATSAGEDEWADISSLDAVSMGSSQADVGSTSTEDSASHPAKGPVKSKTQLEELSSASTSPSDQSTNPPRPMDTGQQGWDTDQQKVYEMQLENLQEQLVDIMIENQTLAQKLQRYENSDVIPLLRRLEDEREKNESLTQRCEVLERHVTHNRPLRQISMDAEETRTGGDEADSSGQDELDSAPPSRWETFQNAVLDRVFTLMADFTEEAEDAESDEGREGDELTVKKLKENLKRFKVGYEPGLLFCRAVSALVSWKSASNTLFTFLIYMYVVWRGWTATVMLGLMIWYLTTTYFISRGWTIEFSLLPYHLVEVLPDEGPPLSMSDRFQLVLHVSRKVQNLLGHLADQMEKFRNFVYWTNPDLTRQLYTNLVIAFVVSLFVSGSTLLTLIGLYLGVKIFIINMVLKRYPRLKSKYSFEQKVFKEVPTNAELEQRRAIEETEQFLVPDIEGITIRLAGEESHDTQRASRRFKAFAEIFNVPESEQPLPGWKDGKRCTLISKNTVTGAFKNGRLYLTKSFVCFEKSKLMKEGNMLLPLKDITRIEKAKPFSFLPGSGWSIVIHLTSADKPVLFGGILNRNLVYEQIRTTWESAQRALQHRNSERDLSRSGSERRVEEPPQAGGGQRNRASSSGGEDEQRDSHEVEPDDNLLSDW